MKTAIMIYLGIGLGWAYHSTTLAFEDADLLDRLNKLKPWARDLNLFSALGLFTIFWPLAFIRALLGIGHKN